MAKKDIIDVMIVDDHPLFRHGLRTVLEAYDDMHLIGEAENGKEALEMCEKNQPDVILMDILMPVLDGAKTTSRLLKKWPEIKIIALTSFKNKDLIENVLKAGATSFIQKNVSSKKLIDIIRDAHKGKPTLSSEATQIMISELRSPTDKKFKLTNREKEILVLLVEGLPNKGIAKRLTLSNPTVHFHVSNILNKLGVSKRTEAIYLALKQKLVSLPE